ncbi:hypothetical protein [Mediterraneibacter gnavus]|uniref:hypothetical protein n=1 Tax=Mediterraneibacter gnavus TaxID=33038 RepID=UPI0031B5C036
MASPKNIISILQKKLKTLKPVIRKKQTSKRIHSRFQIILNLDDPHRKILTHEQSTRLKGADFHDTDTLSHEQPFDSKRKIIRRIALP